MRLAAGLPHFRDALRVRTGSPGPVIGFQRQRTWFMDMEAYEGIVEGPAASLNRWR